MPDVAVLIRTRNEAHWIGRVIDAVRRQTVPADIVVLDSGSTDDTLDEVALRPQVRLGHIAAAEFTYGRALNRGFGACRDASILVALSAHALPRDQRWLEHLVGPLEDRNVGAVFGRQLPHHDLDPFRARAIERYWGDLPFDDGLHGIRFSNANAAIRASVWRDLPFDETLVASEDADWARRALAAGHRIVYRPEAAVYHSHREGPLAFYRRKHAEALARGGQVETPREALERWTGLVRGDFRQVARRPSLWRWAPYSPLLRAAEVLADRVPPS